MQLEGWRGQGHLILLAGVSGIQAAHENKHVFSAHLLLLLVVAVVDVNIEEETQALEHLLRGLGQENWGWPCVWL